MWLGDGGCCSATDRDVLVLCPATWVGLVATAHSPQSPRAGGWLRGSDLGRPEGRCLGQVTREPGRAGNAVSLSGRRRHRCAHEPDTAVHYGPPTAVCLHEKEKTFLNPGQRDGGTETAWGVRVAVGRLPKTQP